MRGRILFIMVTDFRANSIGVTLQQVQAEVHLDFEEISQPLSKSSDSEQVGGAQLRK